MAPRRKYSLWIDDEQAERLRFVKKRDGVLESEQIRRAIDKWLEEKGVKRANRKRPGTRKRRSADQADPCCCVHSPPGRVNR